MFSLFDRLNHFCQLVQCWALFRHDTQAHFNDLIKGRRNKPVNLPCTRCIRVNKALDAMADIIDIRFLCPTGIIQPTGWGYLRRQAVSPMALNVTNNQAVAVIREKKIINTEIRGEQCRGNGVVWEPRLSRESRPYRLQWSEIRLAQEPRHGSRVYWILGGHQKTFPGAG